MSSAKLDVTLEELALFHVGDGSQPGFSQELRESAERRIAHVTVGPFRFRSDRDFRRFVLLTDLLREYVHEQSDPSLALPDHWARGFMLADHKSYKSHVALAFRNLSTQSADNDRLLAKYYRGKREHYVGEWHDGVSEWLNFVGQPDSTSQSALRRTFQRWARSAERDIAHPWRIVYVGGREDMPEDWNPTSLRDPLDTGGSNYLEVWQMVASEGQATTPMLGHWIVLTDLLAEQDEMDPEHRSVRDAALAALGANRPQHVVSSIHLKAAPGMSDRTLCVGPFLDGASASQLAKELRPQGLSTGRVIQEPIERSFRRPAAPEQWTAL